MKTWNSGWEGGGDFPVTKQPLLFSDPEPEEISGALGPTPRQLQILTRLCFFATRSCFAVGGNCLGKSILVYQPANRVNFVNDVYALIGHASVCLAGISFTGFWNLL